MLACKGIFAKPSITQASESSHRAKPKDLFASLSAYIIPLLFFNVNLISKHFYKKMDSRKIYGSPIFIVLRPISQQRKAGVLHDEHA